MARKLDLAATLWNDFNSSPVRRSSSSSVSSAQSLRRTRNVLLVWLVLDSPLSQSQCSTQEAYCPRLWLLRALVSMSFSNKLTLNDWNWRTPITGILNLEENNLDYKKNYLWRANCLKILRYGICTKREKGRELKNCESTNSPYIIEGQGRFIGWTKVLEINCWKEFSKIWDVGCENCFCFE